MAKKYFCTCLKRCKGGKEVSHSTYQRHKSDRNATASSTGIAAGSAMEVEDSSDSDNETEDTGNLDVGLGSGDLDLNDESGMEIDDIPGNHTENPEEYTYTMDQDMSYPSPGVALNQGQDPIGFGGSEDEEDAYDQLIHPDPGCQDLDNNQDDELGQDQDLGDIVDD
ncbi:hypothetical protein BYT27DRAFT_7305688, partial [Phlegmacium glaucopus]